MSMNENDIFQESNSPSIYTICSAIKKQKSKKNIKKLRRDNDLWGMYGQELKHTVL